MILFAKAMISWCVLIETTFSYTDENGDLSLELTKREWKKYGVNNTKSYFQVCFLNFIFYFLTFILNISDSCFEHQAEYLCQCIFFFSQKNYYPALFYDSLFMLAQTLNNSLNEYNIGHYANESDPYIEAWGTPFKQSLIHDGSALFHNYITKGKYQGMFFELV